MIKHRLRVIIIALLLAVIHAAAAGRALGLFPSAEQQHVILWVLTLFLALFLSLACGKNWARVLTVILCGAAGGAGLAAALLSVSGKTAFLDADTQRQLAVSCFAQLAAVAYLFCSRGIKSDLRKLRR